ncbi:MAG: flagellar brake domain-containing protein [Candidatus Sumerlaeia bacterium]
MAAINGNIRDQFHFGKTVLLERTVTKTRKATKLIGARDPNYLIVELPFIENMPMFTETTQSCIVRFMGAGNIYGFRADIVCMLMHPFPMLVLRYPEKYESISVRKNPRIECNIKVSVSTEAIVDGDGDASENTENEKKEEAAIPLRGAIVDISEGGLGLLFPIFERGTPPEAVKQNPFGIEVSRKEMYFLENLEKYFVEEQSIFLNFELPQPSAGTFENVSGKINWASSEGGKFTVGVQFDEMSEELREKANGLIMHQQTYFNAPFSPDY